MEPKIATDIPAMIMVFIPVPSHTMIKGANADLGREFRITRKGSRILETLGRLINRIAERMDNKVTAKKLTMVSSNVIPICLMISKSLHISINNITMALGLLKKKLSIQPSVELISHKAIKEKRRRKRENVMIRD